MIVQKIMIDHKKKFSMILIHLYTLMEVDGREPHVIK